MKRILSILLVLILVSGAVFASDFSFAIGEDIKFPTLLTGGVSYKGLTLSEGNSTVVTATVGGGKGKREFSSPSSSYDFTTAIGDIKLVQGFENDLYKATFGVKGVYETTGTDSDTVLQFYAGLNYSGAEDRMVAKDGIDASAEFRVAPSFSDCPFFGITAQASYFKTVYEKQKDNGMNKFSVVVADRAFASYVSPIGAGSVPDMVVSKYSAGSKVRGYKASDFDGKSFNFANNFEIRLASPEPIWDGVFARLNLFADVGFEMVGSEDSFFYSAGAELALSIFDFVNVGVRFAYPSEEGSLKRSLMFGLQF